MWLRRELRFWGRVARYHLSRTRAGRALRAAGLDRRLLAQIGLLALLVVAGYLLGRVSAPGCAPVASTACPEAQASSPAAPAPAGSQRQTIVVLAAIPAVPSRPDVQPATAPSAADLIPALPEKTAAERVVALTNDEVREMQAWLKAFGFDPGPIDGYPGARTTAAIRRYQAARHTEETGQLDRSLLRKVRREAGHS